MDDSNMANTKTEVSESKLDEFFTTNSKFFGSGDTNGKRSFFCLGQYTRKVMECLEKQAETGVENSYQKKLTKQVTYNMNYKNYSIMMKLLDSYALTCNSKLLACGGLSRQFLMKAEFTSDKKALSSEDANTAFSLGLYEIFK